MDKFTGNILSFIRDNSLIEKGDCVAAAFSGGADSTALLTVLNDIKALLGIKLIAVHVHHGIRDAEADRDEEFCSGYAKKINVPFYSVHVDTPGYVRETGMSEEEAARELRYKALYAESLRAFGMESAGEAEPAGLKIAAAHHAADQAETILLNLLRGSGLKGLSGMRPRRGIIIRPFLMTGKNEILDWLQKKGIPFVTDSTNLENDHTRNRIRNEILPEIQKYVNPRAPEHIALFGERMYEADAYIAAEASAFLDEFSGGVFEDPGGGLGLKLGRQRLKERPQIFRIYVIIEALRRIGTPMKDWGGRHFLSIDRLLFLGQGARADLPGTVSARNIYHETLVINRKF